MFFSTPPFESAFLIVLGFYVLIVIVGVIIRRRWGGK
jgi:hypothetical protein